MHTTTKLNDGYMGSGKHLLRAIKKYGLENFQKTVIAVCEDRKAMLLLEAELVNDEYVSDSNTYNLTVGGKGGFYYINKHKLGMSSDKAKMMIEVRNANLTPAQLREISLKAAKTSKQRQVGPYSPMHPHLPTFLGKHHTEKTKNKMRISAVGKHCGKLNSQFGTMWITNGINNMKIGKDDPIPKGWAPGRKCKPPIQLI